MGRESRKECLTAFSGRVVKNVRKRRGQANQKIIASAVTVYTILKLN
jgi:hypothetical protein